MKKAEESGLAESNRLRPIGVVSVCRYPVFEGKRARVRTARFNVCFLKVYASKVRGRFRPQICLQFALWYSVLVWLVRFGLVFALLLFRGASEDVGSEASCRGDSFTKLFF